MVVNSFYMTLYVTLTCTLTFLPLPSFQVQLGETEQRLLEKELLYEQVGKLVSRASQRAEGQRESTLAIAKKVNQYQAKIRETTRKMMALVSELSMQQVRESVTVV